jgi:hypothetical protein
LVLKNPNLPFPPVLFTTLRGREGRDSTRSKAPPPMSACVAMQFRRDGAKRSFKDRRDGIEQSARKAGWELGKVGQPQNLAIPAITAIRAKVTMTTATNAMKNRSR